jgi:hypothetical protein
VILKVYFGNYYILFYILYKPIKLYEAFIIPGYKNWDKAGPFHYNKCLLYEVLWDHINETLNIPVSHSIATFLLWKRKIFWRIQWPTKNLSLVQKNVSRFSSLKTFWANTKKTRAKLFRKLLQIFSRDLETFCKRIPMCEQIGES